MTMKDVQYDGLKQTTIIGDDKEKKIAVLEKMNINPHLKHNKELLNSNDGYTKDRTLKRVASVPVLALQIWSKEETGQNNWFSLPKETQKKILRKKLNSNEYKYFRTAEGRI